MKMSAHKFFCSRSPSRQGLIILSYIFVLAGVLILPQSVLSAEIVAFDMVGSASQNLIGFSNPWNGAFTSAGDGFQKYQRFVSPSIPFDVVDDSLSIFPPDSHGIIKGGNPEVFFGVVDTVNADNSGPVSATWTFDISGATGLVLSIDMGAMGDFESSDYFEWTYSIDGGPTLTVFESTVDEAGSFTYTLEGGASFTLSDPMLMQGTILSNDLATFSVPLVGTGSELTLTLTAVFNSGREVVAFQNIIVKEGGLPTSAITFDMVGSASQNLIGFSNPWNGAFTSAGDGFQKYQRGVSPSIPFAVLDDSLSIFPPDSLGIIKEGNTDVFFGVVDTDNPSNSGPVSATWTFDISGGLTGLVLSIDMGAMGDFESSDYFEWTYSIDGGPSEVAFLSSVDEAGSFTYTLEGGASFTLNDPMLVEGTILTDDLQTFSVPIVGTGSILTLTLTAVFDSGSEAAAFQNIIVAEVPEVPNQLPIADAGGPYTVNEGDSVQLDASGTTDPGQSSTLTYEWDFDNDGQFDDATGIYPLFSAAVLDGPGSVTVSLRVTNDLGLIDIDSATIDIINVSPTAHAGPDQTVLRNETINLTGSWTDPAESLDNPYAWAWDLDGDAVPDTNGIASYGDTVDETTSFTNEGIYILSFQVTDKDGGSGSDSLIVEVLNQPPVALCQDVTVTAGAECTAPANIDNGSFDPDGDPITLEQDPPGPYAIGNTLVTLTVEDDRSSSDTCQAVVTVKDETAPTVECNAPGTIIPPDAPISFTASSSDNCGVQSVVIENYDCFKFTKKGKRVDKTESCEMTIEGDTITVLDSGGVGDKITWTVTATDLSGNQTTVSCGVEVVNPGRGKNK